MEVDLSKVEKLAESAERRAQELHLEYSQLASSPGLDAPRKAANRLNDFFYWSGKATSYRGIIAMAGLQAVVDEELDAEPTCP